MTSESSSYESNEANTALLIALVFAQLLFAFAMVFVVRWLATTPDGSIALQIVLWIAIPSIGLPMLAMKRVTAEINQVELRIRSRTVVSWLTRRAPQTIVVPVNEILWVRADRNPWDGSIVRLQTRNNGILRFRVGKEGSKNARFRDTLLQLVQETGGIEVKPDWWSTQRGRMVTLAIGLLGPCVAVSAMFIDMAAKLKGSIILLCLILSGYAVYSLFSKRKN